MNSRLLDFLNTIIPISQSLQLRLDLVLKSVEFKKKTVLLREGQMCRHIYFIESGLIRIYYLKDDKEICSGLLYEGGLAISVRSFFKKEKSIEFIETIEDTQLQYLTYDDLERLYKEFPEFNIVGRVLLTEYYIKSEERNYILRRQTALEKYQSFQQLFGQLESRIPRKDIASYLGINLETLSRL